MKKHTHIDQLRALYCDLVGKGAEEVLQRDTSPAQGFFFCPLASVSDNQLHTEILFGVPGFETYEASARLRVYDPRHMVPGMPGRMFLEYVALSVGDSEVPIRVVFNEYNGQAISEKERWDITIQTEAAKIIHQRLAEFERRDHLEHVHAQ